MFQTQQVGQTVILTPNKDLREIDFDRIRAELDDVRHVLQTTPIRNVIVDCLKTAVFDSTTLGSFVRLWKSVSRAGGSMVFCNLSPLEREILELTKLGSVWRICGSRAEAVAGIESSAAEEANEE